MLQAQVLVLCVKFGVRKHCSVVNVYRIWVDSEDKTHEEFWSHRGLSRFQKFMNFVRVFFNKLLQKHF